MELEGGVEAFIPASKLTTDNIRNPAEAFKSFHVLGGNSLPFFFRNVRKRSTFPPAMRKYIYEILAPNSIGSSACTEA